MQSRVDKMKTYADQLSVGTMTVEYGTLKGYREDRKCSEYEDQPTGLSDLNPLASAGVVQISQPQSCTWEVTLNPASRADLMSFERDKPLLAGDYNIATLNLSHESGFEIGKIVQDGPHATVDLVMNFNFTSSMKRLAAVGNFPKLDDADCKYDLPYSRIRCSTKMEMAFVDGKWDVDASNMKKN